MIAENISSVRQRVEAACGRAKRAAGTVTLIAVSKGRPAADIRAAAAAGMTDIGESRVQETAPKFQGLSAALPGIAWHMIGHLQTNKAKEAVRIFGLIHSVDSLRLAREIDKQAALAGKVQDILIEVNTSGEESKYGIAPGQLGPLLKSCGELAHVRARGLMTIAPAGADPESARPYFRALRGLRDGAGLEILSMGMSDDFEIAIEEGATMVRLGRVIFGERDV